MAIDQTSPSPRFAATRMMRGLIIETHDTREYDDFLMRVG